MSPADAEALALMMRLAERALVARSFARIAAGMLQVTATRATEDLRRVARAAAGAAVHVTTESLRRAGRERDKDDDRALDHEALHDDAC